MRLVHGLAFDNIRGDVYAGLAAAVVARPRTFGVLRFGCYINPMPGPAVRDSSGP